ncbi:restriction endonuclease [candidate division WOR-3 bacterium]|nr:restriction endonuclease [candidate division WOR-3 bacterium]
MMKKDELLKIIRNSSWSEDTIHVEPNDTQKISISEIPQDVTIEISTLGEDNIHHVELEGTIGWKDDKICIFMSHDWYRKWWTATLGMPYHMDLMKRLVEFRQKRYKDIEDIDFLDDGDWCHLYYTIIPNGVSTLQEVYQYGLSITNWIDKIVNDAQEQTGKLISKIADEYSSFKLVEIPELINKVQTEQNSNIKGRLLEELLCKFFSKIDGFEIIERLKTETEEIDLVILNMSKDIFWQKESQLILVECKNWSSKCGKNELVVFKEKIVNRRSRAKIGFFVSWNGFKETFRKEDIRTSQGDILIVPVTGEEVIVATTQTSIQESIKKWWLKAVSS